MIDPSAGVPSGPRRGLAVAIGLLLVGGLLMVAVADDGSEQVGGVNPPARKRSTGKPSPPTTRVEGGMVVRDDFVVESPVLSEDGRRLTFSFVGARAFKDGDHCSADYRAVVLETDELVEFVIEEWKIKAKMPRNTGCALLGYTRSASADLARPMGDRALVQRASVGDPRPTPVLPACKSDRPRVRWLPPTVAADSESCRPGTTSEWGWDGSWSTSWSQRDEQGDCTRAGWVWFVYGEAGAFAYDERTATPEPVKLARGQGYLHSLDERGRELRLRWEEGGRRYEVGYRSRCPEFLEQRRADIVRLADSVDVPAPA